MKYEGTNRPFVRGAICIQVHSWVHKNRKCGCKQRNTPVEACEMEPKASLKVPSGGNFQWFLSETQLWLIPAHRCICQSRGPSRASDPDLPAKQTESKRAAMTSAPRIRPSRHHAVAIMAAARDARGSGSRSRRVPRLFNLSRRGLAC